MKRVIRELALKEEVFRSFITDFFDVGNSFTVTLRAAYNAVSTLGQPVEASDCSS